MNRSFNVQMLRVSMLIVLMLLSGIMTGSVYAGNEPPTGGERIIWPPIDGVLTAALDESVFAAKVRLSRLWTGQVSRHDSYC